MVDFNPISTFFLLCILDIKKTTPRRRSIYYCLTREVEKVSKSCDMGALQIALDPVGNQSACNLSRAVVFLSYFAHFFFQHPLTHSSLHISIAGSYQWLFNASTDFAFSFVQWVKCRLHCDWLSTIELWRKDRAWKRLIGKWTEAEMCIEEPGGDGLREFFHSKVIVVVKA